MLAKLNIEIKRPENDYVFLRLKQESTQNRKKIWLGGDILDCLVIRQF